MTTLPMIDPNGAAKEPGDLMQQAEATLGSIPNMVRIMASSPAVLQGYLGFVEALNAGVLSPTLREQIAVVVSEVNACEYCLSRHVAACKELGLVETEILAARDGYASDARTAAVLRFVRNLVAYRADLTDDEVNALKREGVSDAEVVEIVANVALNIYTNYFNSVAQTEIDPQTG